MEFRTQLPASSSPIRLSHQTPVLTLGSCFADRIGHQLTENKFKAQINPFGVLFNPLSILKALNASLDNSNPFSDSFVENNGIWYNYDLHSNLSHQNLETLTRLIAERIRETHTNLKNTQVITITFGTAFVYRLNLTNEVVANCHKIPSSNFKKELLSPEDIVKAFTEVYTRLKSTYPLIQVILTVSPVRHPKDGMEANTISKSVLRVACHYIQKDFPEVDYFPSYEIMMDDLRDYRFYGKDMIHPSETAEEYIWNKFLERYTHEETRKLIEEWNSVKKALSHKAFHPQSEAHQKFLKETYKRLDKLSSAINVEEEMNKLRIAMGG